MSSWARRGPETDARTKSKDSQSKQDEISLNKGGGKKKRRRGDRRKEQAKPNPGIWWVSKRKGKGDDVDDEKQVDAVKPDHGRRKQSLTTAHRGGAYPIHPRSNPSDSSPASQILLLSTQIQFQMHSRLLSPRFRGSMD